MAFSDFEKKKDYLLRGFKKMYEEHNYGCLVAFPDREMNGLDFEFDREVFLEIINNETSFFVDGSSLPSKFVMNIRYSPIVDFNRWVFYISNRKYHMFSQRDKHFERSYFLMDIDGESARLVPIYHNAAHERFLMHLYGSPRIKKTLRSLSLTLTEPRLLIYRDYRTDEKLFLDFGKEKYLIPKNIEAKALYVKMGREIKYRIVVEKQRYKCSINLGGEKATLEKTLWKSKEPKKEVVKKTHKNTEDDFQKVVALVSASVGKTLLTNKFANISLGRVGGIQALINLSVMKYANAKVVLEFGQEDEVLIRHNSKVIKIFHITDKPKSNWLVGKKA